MSGTLVTLAADITQSRDGQHARPFCESMFMTQQNKTEGSLAFPNNHEPCGCVSGCSRDAVFGVAADDVRGQGNHRCRSAADSQRSHVVVERRKQTRSSKSHRAERLIYVTVQSLSLSCSCHHRCVTIIIMDSTGPPTLPVQNQNSTHKWVVANRCDFVANKRPSLCNMAS